MKMMGGKSVKKVIMIIMDKNFNIFYLIQSLERNGYKVSSLHYDFGQSKEFSEDIGFAGNAVIWCNNIPSGGGK